MSKKPIGYTHCKNCNEEAVHTSTLATGTCPTCKYLESEAREEHHVRKALRIRAEQACDRAWELNGERK